MSVNKFFPINIQNANNIVGTYGNVSLLVNANEETKGTSVLKQVAINQNIDPSYNLVVSGNTRISNLDIIDSSVNIYNQSDIIAITNGDATIPSIANNSYQLQYQYSAPGNYTGTGYSTSGLAYSILLLKGLDYDYYQDTNFNPTPDDTCFILQSTGGGSVVFNTSSYAVANGVYTFSWYLMSSDTQNGGIPLVVGVYDSANTLIIESQVLNAVSVYPLFLYGSLTFTIKESKNIYLKFTSQTLTGAGDPYTMITRIELKKSTSINITDTSYNTTASISGKTSILNDLVVNDGLRIQSGGINIVGQILNKTAYGSNNTTINTSLGTTNLTTGYDNVAIGTGALQQGRAVIKSVAIGATCCPYVYDISECVAIGSSASIENNNIKQIVIGYLQGLSPGGSLSVNIGAKARTDNGFTRMVKCAVVGSQTCGELRYNGFNVLQTTHTSVLGHGALAKSHDRNNTAIGYETLYNLVGVDGNTDAGNSGKRTPFNTALGYVAGYTPTDASYCTFVGALTDATTNVIGYSTAIGYNAKISESDTIVLGGQNVDAFYPTIVLPVKNKIYAVKSLVAGDGANYSIVRGECEVIHITTNTQTNINLPFISSNNHIGTTFTFKKTYTPLTAITITAQTGVDIVANGTSANTYNFSSTQSFVKITCIASSGTNRWAVVASEVSSATTPTLTEVLAVGNKAGTAIDMSNNNIINCNNLQVSTINGLAPSGSPSLAQVLSVGNKASTAIDMSNNNILNAGSIKGTSAVLTGTLDMSLNNIINLNKLRIKKDLNVVASGVANAGILIENNESSSGSENMVVNRFSIPAYIDDDLFAINVYGYDGVSNATEYTRINSKILNPDNTMPLGEMEFFVRGGTSIMSNYKVLKLSNTKIHALRNLDMSNNNIVNVNNINLNTINGLTPRTNLSEILAGGNSANIYNIDMSGNDLLNVKGIQFRTGALGSLNLNASNITNVNSITMTGDKNINLSTGNLQNVLQIDTQRLNQAQTSTSQYDLKLQNTSDTASIGVRTKTTRFRSTLGLSAGDKLYDLETFGTNSSTTEVQYADDSIEVVASTAGSHSGKRIFQVANAGALSNVLEMGLPNSTFSSGVAMPSISLAITGTTTLTGTSYGSITYLASSTVSATINLPTILNGAVLDIFNSSSNQHTITSTANIGGPYGSAATTININKGQGYVFVGQSSAWRCIRVYGLPYSYVRYHNAAQTVSTTSVNALYNTEGGSVDANTNAWSLDTWNGSRLTYNSTNGTFTNDTGFPMTIKVNCFAISGTLANGIFIGVRPNAARHSNTNPYYYQKSGATNSTAVCQTEWTLYLGTGESFNVVYQATASTAIGSATAGISNRIIITRIG